MRRVEKREEEEKVRKALFQHTYRRRIQADYLRTEEHKGRGAMLR